MKKLKRIILIVLTTILTLAMTACTPKSAFDFDEDAAITRAKEIIDVVNTKDYAAIYALFADDAKKLTTVDGIQAAFQPILDPLGAFVEYKSAEAVGTLDKDGNKYINVYVKTKYENTTHIYNVALNTDLGLEGFFTVS